MEKQNPYVKMIVVQPVVEAYIVVEARLSGEYFIDLAGNLFNKELCVPWSEEREHILDITYNTKDTGGG